MIHDADGKRQSTLPLLHHPSVVTVDRLET